MQQGTVTLETERLLLRPFRVSDAEAAFRNWTNDPLVTRYLTWTPHEDVAFTRQLFQEWEEASARPDFYQWAIVWKESGEAVGSVSVTEQDLRVGRAQLGYCLSRALWGRGLMTEALNAVIDHLFSVGFERVEAVHAVQNPASGRVMQKCGMSFEGVLRKYCRASTGELTDVCMRSILRGEWEGAPTKETIK